MVKDQAVWGIVQHLQVHRAQTVLSTVCHKDRHHVTQYTSCEHDGTLDGNVKGLQMLNS